MSLLPLVLFMTLVVAPAKPSQVVNFDQKPFHTNESGSKDLRTLDFKGAKTVALKEIHSQTRERWTACTACFSDKRGARKVPPLFCVFKGGEEILRSSEEYIARTPLFQEAGEKFKVAVSNSASMRKEHVLDYLNWLLPLLREDMAETAWGILLCDAYRAHISDSIMRLAWEFQFVVIFIGGGATGVVQVNDTHLHGPLSREYMEREMTSMFEAMQADPHGCPGRTRYQCMSDLMLVWQDQALHLRSCEGFLQNQLTNKLDGSEDHLACSEVSAFWAELNMGRWRDESIEEVCQEWEAKRLDWSFEAVYGLVELFPLTGHVDFYEELQDDEGEDAVGDLPWNDREEPSPASSDDELDQTAAPAESGHAQPDLDEAQKKEVEDARARLAGLDRALTNAGHEPQIARAIQDVRGQILKEAAGRSQKESKVAAAIRRQEKFSQDLDASRMAIEVERRRSCEAREAAIQKVLDSMDARVKELVREEMKVASAPAGHASKEALEEKKARRLAIQSAAQSFRLKELGQGADKAGVFQQARFKLISRVFALGDRRTPRMEANWKTWLHRLDEKGRKLYTIRWAAFLQRQMAELVQKMEAGDTGACLDWYRERTREWSLNAGAFTVPAALSIVGGSSASGSVGAPPPAGGSSASSSAGASAPAVRAHPS